MLCRDRAAVDGKTGESGSSDQRNYPFRFNVQIQKDPDLNSHGLTLSSQIPILVQEVTTGRTISSKATLVIILTENSVQNLISVNGSITKFKYLEMVHH